MKIEGNANELQALFGEGVVNLHGYNNRRVPIFLNGKTFFMEEFDHQSEYSIFYGHQDRYTMYLKELTVVKSPQEVAAEEAVQSAKESLKAAEAVLKQLKEK